MFWDPRAQQDMVQLGILFGNWSMCQGTHATHGPAHPTRIHRWLLSNASARLRGICLGVNIFFLLFLYRLCRCHITDKFYTWSISPVHLFMFRVVQGQDKKFGWKESCLTPITSGVLCYTDFSWQRMVFKGYAFWAHAWIILADKQDQIFQCLLATYSGKE